MDGEPLTPDHGFPVARRRGGHTRVKASKLLGKTPHRYNGRSSERTCVWRIPMNKKTQTAVEDRGNRTWSLIVNSAADRVSR